MSSQGCKELDAEAWNCRYIPFLTVCGRKALPKDAPPHRAERTLMGLRLQEGAASLNADAAFQYGLWDASSISSRSIRAVRRSKWSSD